MFSFVGREIPPELRQRAHKEHFAVISEDVRGCFLIGKGVIALNGAKVIDYSKPVFECFYVPKTSIKGLPKYDKLFFKAPKGEIREGEVYIYKGRAITESKEVKVTFQEIASIMRRSKSIWISKEFYPLLNTLKLQACNNIKAPKKAVKVYTDIEVLWSDALRTLRK